MQDRSTDDPTAMAKRLVGRWELLTLGGERIEASTQKGERQPDLTIEESNTVRGWAGVNAYTGTLDAAALARGEFRPGPFITTKRAGPPTLMKLEERLLSTLSSAETYSEGGGRLILLRGEQELAVFRRR